MPQNFEPSRESAAGRERTFAERKATMAEELVILARSASEWLGITRLRFVLVLAAVGGLVGRLSLCESAAG